MRDGSGMRDWVFPFRRPKPDLSYALKQMKQTVADLDPDSEDSGTQIDNLAAADFEAENYQLASRRSLVLTSQPTVTGLKSRKYEIGRAECLFYFKYYVRYELNRYLK
jgi:hypothetical protein